MNAQTQQMVMGIVMWIAVFAVFYFLLIRPQKKKKEIITFKTSVRGSSFSINNAMKTSEGVQVPRLVTSR